MYSHLYNQAVNIKKTNGTDEYGKPKILEIKEKVSCRIEYKNKLLISPNGKQVTCKGLLCTDEKIMTADILVIENDEHIVLQVAPLIDFDGNIRGYQVYF